MRNNKTLKNMTNFVSRRLGGPKMKELRFAEPAFSFMLKHMRMRTFHYILSKNKWVYHSSLVAGFVLPLPTKYTAA